jgi:hypothetical protein
VSEGERASRAASPNLTIRYTEKDWNEDSIPHIEANGDKSQPSHSYRASKTLAEKALWSESREAPSVLIP